MAPETRDELSQAALAAQQLCQHAQQAHEALINAVALAKRDGSKLDLSRVASELDDAARMITHCSKLCLQASFREEA